MRQYETPDYNDGKPFRQPATVMWRHPSGYHYNFDGITDDSKFPYAISDTVNDEGVVKEWHPVNIYIAPVLDVESKTLIERQEDARALLRGLFTATDQKLAELENHAKEDARLAGIPFDPESVDYSTWIEAKAVIRSAHPIPTE